MWRQEFLPDLIQTNSAQTNELGNPDASAQARQLELDSATTASNLNNAHARTQARAGQLITEEAYLAEFPDRQVYWLDHFALRTGKSIDGISQLMGSRFTIWARQRG